MVRAVEQRSCLHFDTCWDEAAKASFGRRHALLEEARVPDACTLCLKAFNSFLRILVGPDQAGLVQRPCKRASCLN